MLHACLVPMLMAGACLVSTAPTSAAERPNILIVMVDDMGWSDLGCYGGEVRTPNIDRLAAGGLRFTQFYNTSRCCPTRAALLTGLYPHQAGIGQMTFDKGRPGYRGWLQPDCVTIAEVLRPAGYRTAMVGKWHVSLTEMLDDHIKHLNNQVIRSQFADPATYPVARGFEEHYGVIWGVVDYFDPFSLVHNRQAIESVPDDYYITDAFSDHAVEYVEKYSRDGEPFFLYLAYTAPHWPLHAPEPDIERYRDTYRPGWEAIREARFRRQVEMGLVDPANARLSPRQPDTPAWPENPTQTWDAGAMAVHAAMIDRVDQGVGRIVARLGQLGLYENTLILVLSDNGASPEVPGRPGFDRNSETRDGKPVVYFGRGQPKDVMPGPETTYASIGPHWANVANSPFRYWKAEQYEGGICTPLVVHWPKGLAVEPGSITAQPGHVIDLMATCVELAGAEYPAEYQGRRITPLEGKSLVPVFQGEQRPGHEAIFFEHFAGRAVRRGDWKLVARSGAPWELYNLAADRTETNDLAAAHPDKVAELEALWSDWANRANVFPSPDAGADRQTFSRKTHFRLSQGASLPRQQAPYLVGREITVTATIRGEKADGVVVAQGGDTWGYALYVGNGLPTLAVRREGTLTAITGTQPLPQERVELVGRLLGDGRLLLSVDGSEIAAGSVPGRIDVMPLDGLQVGRDDRSAVGDYRPPNPFAGTIEEVTISLGEP